jgi:Apea-like HEPN
MSNKKNSGNKKSVDTNKLKLLSQSLSDFTRRVHQELKSDSNLETKLEGKRSRLVGNVIYTDSFIDEVNKLEQETYKLVWKENKISKKEAGRLLHRAINSAIYDEKKVRLEGFEEALRHASENFKKDVQQEAVEWTYVIRVSGFEPNGLPLSLGKVRLATLSETEVKEFGKESATAEDHLRKRKRDEVVAQVTVEAVDSDAALANALREVQRTLDMVNFFINNDYPPLYGVHLPWERQGTNEQFIGFSKRHTVVQHSMTGAFIKFDIRLVNKDARFKRASELLAARKPNTFQQRLLSALQWAGRASSQERFDQSFLFYAISLENLLLGNKNKAELSYRLSVHGAHLIGTDELTRNTISRNLVALYQLRSDLVHAGSAEISDLDLAMIRRYAKYGVYRLLSDDTFYSMEKEERLDEFFKSKVLA